MQTGSAYATVGLTKLIADATSELETAVAAEREVQSIARRKARLTRQGKPPADTILAKLAKPPLASPFLLAEAHVCREKRKWLQARMKAAEKSLAIHRYNRDEIQAGRSYGDLSASIRHVANWDREIEAVGDELAKAMADSDDLHDRLLNE